MAGLALPAETADSPTSPGNSPGVLPEPQSFGSLFSSLSASQKIVPRDESSMILPLNAVADARLRIVSGRPVSEDPGRAGTSVLAAASSSSAESIHA